MKELILIIDDEEDMANSLRCALEDEGYNVLISNDGEDGFEKVKHHCPDLVILDLKLPRMPGESVCKEIRKHKRISKIPIIMLTAKDSDADKVIGRVVGADCYMTKPFDVTFLFQKIEEVLKNRKRKRVKRVHGTGVKNK